MDGREIEMDAKEEASFWASPPHIVSQLLLIIARTHFSKRDGGGCLGGFGMLRGAKVTREGGGIARWTHHTQHTPTHKQKKNATSRRTNSRKRERGGGIYIFTCGEAVRS